MRYFIVSDLHLNMGKTDGKLHPLEDFDSDDAFARLLEAALRDKAELIVNGDWVDFLQLDPFLPVGDYRSADGIPLGWTKREAAKKLETCLTTQHRHFVDLADYLGHGGRVTILQGNHDPDWFFPADSPSDEPPLQKMLRQHLGNPSGDALRFEATFVRLGTVHVEHGHQQCELANCFQRHPDIFYPDRREALLGQPRFELLWGSYFVLSFFNDLEWTHPFADNLKPTFRALVLGVRNGWVNGKTAADLLKYLWGSGIPWKDVAQLLDRKDKRDPLKLVQGLKDPYLRDVFFERFKRDPSFRTQLESALQAEPQHEIEALHPNERSESGSEEVTLNTAQTLGVIRKPRELRQAKRLLDNDGVTAVVFGHTHQAINGSSEHAPLAGYFNTGTWTPYFDLSQPGNRALLKEQKLPLEIFMDPSKFPRALTYADVRVEPDGCRVALEEAS